MHLLYLEDSVARQGRLLKTLQISLGGWLVYTPCYLCQTKLKALHKLSLLYGFHLCGRVREKHHGAALVHSRDLVHTPVRNMLEQVAPRLLQLSLAAWESESGTIVFATSLSEFLSQHSVVTTSESCGLWLSFTHGIELGVEVIGNEHRCLEWGHWPCHLIDTFGLHLIELSLVKQVPVVNILWPTWVNNLGACGFTSLRLTPILATCNSSPTSLFQIDFCGLETLIVGSCGAGPINVRHSKWLLLQTYSRSIAPASPTVYWWTSLFESLQRKCMLLGELVNIVAMDGSSFYLLTLNDCIRCFKPSLGLDCQIWFTRVNYFLGAFLFRRFNH